MPFCGVLFLCLIIQLITLGSFANAKKKSHDLQVILLSTSKFWHNFRQGTNVLLIYDILKKHGVKDSNILLMIPENSACNSRNNKPGVVCHLDQESYPNLIRNAEVDYKLHDITIDSVINVIKGRFSQYTPRSKRLVLNKNSKLFTYFSGHGGDGYIKIQDSTAFMDDELKETINDIQSKKFYQEILMFSDSCGAATLFEKVNAPNFFGLGSSSKGEKSYSYGNDPNMQLSVVDAFTRIVYMFLNEQLSTNKKMLSMGDLMREIPQTEREHFSFTNTYPKKTEKNIYLRDFLQNLNPKVFDLMSLGNSNNSQKLFLQQILSQISLSSPLPEQSDFIIANPSFIEKLKQM